MNNSKSIIRNAIQKKNMMFNPSYNLHAEALSGESNDRTSYDYADCEMEALNN